MTNQGYARVVDAYEQTDTTLVVVVEGGDLTTHLRVAGRYAKGAARHRDVTATRTSKRFGWRGMTVPQTTVYYRLD